MTIIDLTHTVTNRMPVFPGDRVPRLSEYRDRRREIVHYRIEASMHTGTHIDGPLHMIPNGRKLSEIDISRFVANGHLIDARGSTALDISLLDGHTIAPGDCVLLYAGWHEKFRTPDFYADYPCITEELAHALVERKIAFIGIDTPSPDVAPYNIHRILLQKEILIIECMNNLSRLLGAKEFEVIALPPKFCSDSAPVRVLAKIQK
ncbi:cyclase family protein [Candidatus Uhrbacteria bacterium]|nr:cyclase family protein [Candidatus Uhrbacteria bacterium]